MAPELGAKLGAVPRSSSTRGPRLAAGVVSLVLIAAACSSGSGNAGDGETVPLDTATTVSTSVPPTTGSSSTTSTTIAGDPTLSVLMLDTVPSGLVRLPDQLSDSGPTNLAKAANDEVQSGAAAFLKQVGFVSGYQRVWSSGDSVKQNTIFLYRFETAAGAAQYATNRASELNSFGSIAPITTFAVPMPGGVGLHSESAQQSFGAVVFSKGVYSVQAVSTDAISADQTALVVQLAQAQFDRLP